MSRHDAVILLTCLLASLSTIARSQEPAGAASRPNLGEQVLDQDDRDYLLRKQQEIFRLNVETDYALALQKLCQTGYGNPRLCQPAIAKPSMPAPPMPAPAAGPTDGAANPRHRSQPIVQEISGAGNDLAAVLLLPDGRRLTVHAGSGGDAATVLPDGASVMAIDAKQVVLRRPGGAPVALPLERAHEEGAEP